MQSCAIIRDYEKSELIIFNSSRIWIIKHWPHPILSFIWYKNWSFCRRSRRKTVTFDTSPGFTTLSYSYHIYSEVPYFPIDLRERCSQISTDARVSVRAALVCLGGHIGGGMMYRENLALPFRGNLPAITEQLGCIRIHGMARKLCRRYLSISCMLSLSSSGLLIVESLQACNYSNRGQWINYYYAFLPCKL